MKNAVKNYLFGVNFNSTQMIAFAVIMGATVHCGNRFLEFAIKLLLVAGSFTAIKLIGDRVMGESK